MKHFTKFLLVLAAVFIVSCSPNTTSDPVEANLTVEVENVDNTRIACDCGPCEDGWMTCSCDGETEEDWPCDISINRFLEMRYDFVSGKSDYINIELYNSHEVIITSKSGITVYYDFTEKGLERKDRLEYPKENFDELIAQRGLGTTLCEGEFSSGVTYSSWCILSCCFSQSGGVVVPWGCGAVAVIAAEGWCALAEAQE